MQLLAFFIIMSLGIALCLSTYGALDKKYITRKNKFIHLITDNSIL